LKKIIYNNVKRQEPKRIIRYSNKNCGKKWTRIDRILGKKMIMNGALIEDVAYKLGRSLDSINIEFKSFRDNFQMNKLIHHKKIHNNHLRIMSKLKNIIINFIE
jgi:hypothetical protein